MMGRDESKSAIKDLGRIADALEVMAGIKKPFGYALEVHEQQEAERRKHAEAMQKEAEAQAKAAQQSGQSNVAPPAEPAEEKKAEVQAKEEKAQPAEGGTPAKGKSTKK